MNIDEYLFTRNGPSPHSAQSKQWFLHHYQKVQRPSYFLSISKTQIVTLVHSYGHFIHDIGIHESSIFWGHVKDLICKKNLKNALSHKSSINDSFSNIQKETLSFVTDNLVTKLRYSITSENSHFENLIHSFSTFIYINVCNL